MGRNEIRLRRQKMNSGRIAQHRNYTQLMQLHERDVRLRRVTRTVVYFLIILALLIIFIIVKRWEDSTVGDKKTSGVFVDMATPDPLEGNDSLLNWRQVLS